MFTDTSAGTDWDPLSGAPAGVSENDPGVESVQSADYRELAAEDQRWERQHYLRCNFTHADLSRAQLQRSAFVGCTTSRCAADERDDRGVQAVGVGVRRRGDERRDVFGVVIG